MKKFTRRKFLQTGLAGTVFTFAGVSSAIASGNALRKIDRVQLGNTGIVTSRLAMGLGTNGWNYESNQTRMGMERFREMVRYGYERGIRFFDTADMYGSHICVKEALKIIPREKVTIMSKIWTTELKGKKPEPVPDTLDRIRKELDTDYIDILLLHCLQNGNWPEEKSYFMEELQKAKDKGIVKKVGISAHNLDAVRRAADNKWVDVILARINHGGKKMDDKPEVVMPVLERAGKNGKGVIGMKIFGCGELVDEENRERSLNYVIKSGNVDSMTIGFESSEQVEDAVNRITRIVSGV